MASASALIATVAVATAPTAALAGSAKYFNGFENNGDRTEAKAMFSVTPVAGTAAAPAASGSWYATAAPGSDVFSRLGGYSNKFPVGGYSTSIDAYVDVASLGQFEWSSAVNGTDGNHRRDFIFHVGRPTDGQFQVSVSNNSQRNASDGLARSRSRRAAGTRSSTRSRTSAAPCPLT